MKTLFLLLDYLTAPLGGVLLFLGRWCGRRKSLLLKLLTWPLRIAGAGALAVYAHRQWYRRRPQPLPAQENTFAGVTVIHEVRTAPRPLVIHVAQVDLGAPGVQVLITPPQPTGGRALASRTVSQFMRDFGVQVAVNASFFTPAWWTAPWDYYPHAGKPVDVYGLTASAGQMYAAAQPDMPTLYIGQAGKASFAAPPDGEVYSAVSGSQFVLCDGHAQGLDSLDAYLHALHPRTAAGLDAAGTTLILVVVDGRQPGYSEGVSLPELGAILAEYGAHDGINLDGGGSSALWVEGPDGQPQRRSSPVDGWLPGYERPGANQIGIYARRAGTGEA